MPNTHSSDQRISAPQLELNRRPGAPSLMVDMQGFFEFSFWLAEELLDLEALHCKPQNASQLRNSNLVAFARKFNIS